MADRAGRKSGIPQICWGAWSQLFGREAERRRIEELLALASAGPIGIAVGGAPGIGKTTVWRDAVENARVRGYRVLVAAPSEPDAALAFSGLGDLLDDVDDELFEHLPAPQRRALSAALFLSEPLDAPVDVDALPRATLGVLRQLAADATVVMAIDDEQWLDRASARVLAFALRRISEERLCLLLSRRADSEGPLWSELKDAFRPGIEPIELAGVDLATTGRLLVSVLGPKIPRRLLARVHEVSGGNPLYALALGAELKRAGTPVEDWRELPIPSTLAAAMTQRLNHVRAGVEAPLFAIAALADPTVARLRAAVDEFHVTDLDAAVRAGVIEVAGGRVRFTHPLMASVHRASVPARRRHELHLRLAGVARDPEERARHLALGTEAADEPVASELEQAAALAVRRGAPEAAADLLEHAIRLTPVDNDEARWSRTATAAEQRYTAGDLEQARVLLEQLLLEQPGGRISARARLQLAMVRTDDFEFAASMLEQALLDACDDDRLIMRIALVYADWSANIGDYAGMVERAERAVACAERLGEPATLASALAGLGRALFTRGQGLPRDLFERAIELERSAEDSGPTFYLPSTIYGTLLRHENDLGAARPLLEGAVARARRRGEEGDALIPLLVRLAWLEAEAGNPAESDRWLARRRVGAPASERRDGFVGRACSRRNRGEPGRTRTSAVACRRSAAPRQRQPRRSDATKWRGAARGHRAVGRRAADRAPALTALAGVDDRQWSAVHRVEESRPVVIRYRGSDRTGPAR